MGGGVGGGGWVNRLKPSLHTKKLLYSFAIVKLSIEDYAPGS